MERSAQQIVDMYGYEGPESTVEGQIVAIEESVRKKAGVKAVAIGVVGCLLLGVGMSPTMVTSGFFVLGIVIGVIGLAVVCANYPLYKRDLAKMRAAAKPRSWNSHPGYGPPLVKNLAGRAIRDKGYRRYLAVKAGFAVDAVWAVANLVPASSRRRCGSSCSARTTWSSGSCAWSRL